MGKDTKFPFLTFLDPIIWKIENIFAKEDILTNLTHENMATL